MLKWLSNKSKESKRNHKLPRGRTLMSVPDKFDDGDLELWLKCFSMCASANGWDNAKKLLYLPTFLRGRAFAVYERLSDADRGTSAALEVALKVFTPGMEESRRLAHSQLASRQLEGGKGS